MKESVPFSRRNKSLRSANLHPDFAPYKGMTNTQSSLQPDQPQQVTAPQPVGLPPLKAWQIKTEKIIVPLFGFVIFPAMVLFLLAQIPDLIRRVSSGDLSAVWPPSKGFVTAVILGLGAMFASAFPSKKK